MAEIFYSDGTKVMFETAGDMLTFYIAPDKYEVTDAQKDRGNIDRILMKDYNSKAGIDARQAALVYKSKINGPMGPDGAPTPDVACRPATRPARSVSDCCITATLKLSEPVSIQEGHC